MWQLVLSSDCPVHHIFVSTATHGSNMVPLGTGRPRAISAPEPGSLKCVMYLSCGGVRPNALAGLSDTIVAQLVRAAEPVHPMCSVTNNPFLYYLVGQGRAPATNETGCLSLRSEWVAATPEVTRARTARTAISAVLAHPRHEQSTLPGHANPSATLVSPPTLSCSVVSVALGATPNEPVASLPPSSRPRRTLCRR